MDPFSPVAPAHIRVLVLPVGPFERHRFVNFVRRLQNEASNIPLQELQSDSPNDKFLLSPSVFPEGCLFFSFSASNTTDQQQLLSPFELFREPLLVLGIVGELGQDVEQRRDQLKKATEVLRERHARVMHRHLIVLQDGHDETLQQIDNVTLLSQSDNQEPALRVAVKETALRFLRELTTYCQAMQASPGIQTPGQLSRRFVRSAALHDEEGKPRSGHSTPQEVTSPVGEDGTSRPPSRDLPTAVTSFDQIPAANTVATALARSDSHGSAKNKSRARGASLDRISTLTLSREKLKDRGKARVGMVLGSLHMMAGQWNEALKVLNDSTIKLRALGDHIWHAKGLENTFVCLILHAWAGVDFQVPPICYQLSDRVRDRFSVNLPAEIQQKIGFVQTPIQRLSSSLPELLRHILMLYRSLEGSMELPYLPVSESTIRFSKLLAILHNFNGLLQGRAFSQIVEGPRIGVSSEVGSETASPKPKTAQHTKSMAKTAIADILADALPVTDDALTLLEHMMALAGVASVYGILRMHRKRAITLKELLVRLTGAIIQARKLGAAEVGIHPAASLSIEHGADALIDTMSESGGLISMMTELGKVYGVQDIDDFKPKDGQPASEEKYLEFARMKSFGNDQLKFEILRELLAFCEASPNVRGVLHFLPSFMASAGPFAALDAHPEHSQTSISKDEQLRLIATVNRTTGVSRQLGLADAEVTYWDSFMVRDVAFLASGPDLALVDRSKLKTGAHSGQQGQANPLLYDPNAPRATLAERGNILVLEDWSICCVTLQNPFDVALEIESLELVTEGAEIRSCAQSIQLGPARLQQTFVSVTPSATGKTSVKGCRIKVVGCHEQIFHLVRKPWMAAKPLVVKAIGQDACHTDELPKGKPSEPEKATVSVDMIVPQPVLTFDHTSFPGPSVMLLEGERRSLSIKISNVSAVEASILEISSSDKSLRHHANGPGSGADLAVLEAGSTADVTFDLVGEAGPKDVRADIFYSSSKDGKYARLLSMSISVTVKPALQIRSLDVSALGEDDFLLRLDMANAWAKAVRFTCSVLDENNEWQGFLDDSLAPDQVLGLHVPMQRWIKSVEEHADVERVRSELFERIKLDWDVGERVGEVALRGLPLSSESADIVRGDAIAVRLELVQGGQPPGGPSEKSKNTAKVGSFVTVRATLDSRSNGRGPLLLQLQPELAGVAALDDRRVAVAGSFHRLLPPLPAAGRRTVDFALCPLLSGIVRVGASVGSAVSSLARAPDPAGQSHAQRALVLRVVD